VPGDPRSPPMPASGLSPRAPRGRKNGNYTNGNWTAGAIEERRWLRLLVRAFAQKEIDPVNEKRALPQGADRKARTPMRVKLERKNCDLARAPRRMERRGSGGSGSRMPSAPHRAHSSRRHYSSSLPPARLPGGGISENSGERRFGLYRGCEASKRG
jgi:hypothetical protein